MSYDPNSPRPFPPTPSYGAPAYGTPPQPSVPHQQNAPYQQGAPRPYGAPQQYVYPEEVASSPYASPSEPSPAPTQNSAAHELMARMSELESNVTQHWVCALTVPLAHVAMMAWFGGAIALAVAANWDGRDIGSGIAFLQPFFSVVALLFSTRLIAAQSNGLYQAALITLGQTVLAALGLVWGILGDAEAWAYAFGIGSVLLLITTITAWIGGMARGLLLERRIPLYISLDDCGVWLATYSANDPQRVIVAQTQGPHAHVPMPPNPYR